MKFLYLISFLLLITCSACCFAPSKSANEIVVPIDYSTIQGAINAASPYDTIYVNEGVYEERLLIDKPLFIRGASGDAVVIVTKDDDDIITVETSNVVISNFVIRKIVSSSSKSAGVKLLNSSYCVIENNTIIGNFIGVLIEGGSFNYVQDNIIIMNRYGIFVRRYLHEFESHNNFILNNLIANNSWNGIEIGWGGANTVCSNTICYNTAFGFEIPDYTPSSANLIFHNNFIGNAVALGRIYQAYSPPDNYWNFSGEGNYWDDFCGFDENYDAISDLPYRLNSNVVDYFPLMGIFRTFKVCDSNVSIISNAFIYELNCNIADDGNKPFVIDIIISSDRKWFAKIYLPKPFYSFSYLEVNGYYSECRNCVETDSYTALYVDDSNGVYLVAIYGLYVNEYSLPYVLLSMLLSFIMLCVKKVSNSVEIVKA